MHDVVPSEPAEHVPFGLSPQVQPVGQPWSAVHATTFRLHDLVPLGAQLQSGAGGVPESGVEPEFAGGAGSAPPPLADGAGVGVGAGAGAGVALPLLGALPLPLLALPLLALPEPELALPPLLAHVHDCSISHVKPSPQSASAWHGTRYFGTHAETCSVVQAGADDGGHFWPASHAVVTSQTSWLCV